MLTSQVNKKAPDFEMDDFKGNRFVLSDFKEKNNVLIVFNRGFV